MTYDIIYVIFSVMNTTNALKMRQNLGKVLHRLATTGTPILVEQNRRPVAVLIGLDDYYKRFVDVEADLRRNELVQKIKAARISLPRRRTSLDIIREVRAS